MGPYLSVHLGTEAHINTTIAAKKHMQSQIPSSRPDLRQKLTPIYEFGCKRPMFLDTYYPTFLLSHVHLDTSPIQEINSSSITTLSGNKDIDVIIWATGFQTQDYLGHVDVRGTGGVRLKSQWGDTAQAYLGTSVHNFPNLFFIYGPGTGLLWGSLTFMFETQALWVTKVLKTVYTNLGRGKRTAFAVKAAVESEYNVTVQEKMKQLAFTDPKCTSFYKNDRGVVTTNWPWRLAEYWRRLSSIEWENYDIWEARA